MRGATPLVLAMACFTIGASAGGATGWALFALGCFWGLIAGWRATTALLGVEPLAVRERVLRKVAGRPLYSRRRADQEKIAAMLNELNKGS